MCAKRVVMMFLFAVLPFFCIGCGTGKKYCESSFDPVPEGKGRMFFYRNAVPLGVAVMPDIKVNETPVGLSQLNSFTYTDVAPGEYQVSCMTEWRHHIMVPMKAGETKYIQTHIMPGVMIGHVMPELIPTERALRDIKDCQYNGVEKPKEKEEKK